MNTSRSSSFPCKNAGFKSIDSISQFTVDATSKDILKDCLLHVGESILSVRD